MYQNQDPSLTSVFRLYNFEKAALQDILNAAQTLDLTSSQILDFVDTVVVLDTPNFDTAFHDVSWSAQMESTRVSYVCLTC